jgi:hypothetical protein
MVEEASLDEANDDWWTRGAIRSAQLAKRPEKAYGGCWWAGVESQHRLKGPLG